MWEIDGKSSRGGPGSCVAPGSDEGDISSFQRAGLGALTAAMTPQLSDSYINATPLQHEIKWVMTDFRG